MVGGRDKMGGIGTLGSPLPGRRQGIIVQPGRKSQQRAVVGNHVRLVFRKLGC